MQEDNNLVSLFTNKEITRLFKDFLKITEDLQFEHNEMLKKLSAQFGAELIDQINYFTPEKYEHLRKRILDSGNETNRNLASFLDFYDFSINKDKLQQALNQRKTVKKYTSSNAVLVEYNE